MTADPLLGVFFHWLGGLASASFYVPYKRVRRWSWEIFWLTGGIFSWVVAPWSFAALRTEHLLQVLGATPGSTLGWCWFWGALWGFGGLTFGLTMRYLGMSLGMAVVLGLTMVIGTLGPPIFHGALSTLAAHRSGWVTFGGIGLALLGVIIVGRAGRAKERELTPEQTKATIAEFNFKRGLLVAVFSGVMSSCFAFGLDAGAPIRALTLAAGTTGLNQGLPVLCIVLAGGFTTNLIWCVYLILRNGTGGELLGAEGPAPDYDGAPPPLVRNYLLCALAGTAWYFQFFFYTMGESQMGAYAFSSWTLHMASIIIFSTLWGFALKEWAGSSTPTKRIVWTGVLVLVVATSVIGTGNYLSAMASPVPADWPSAPLSAADARQVDANQFLPAGQLREWEIDLDRRGLRATGSAAHEAYVDELARRLRAAGVRDVRFEALPMRRWTARRWSLDLVGGASAGAIPAAAYVPYSGSTPETGITAPLVALPGDGAADRTLAGKIVVFDLPKVKLTMGYFLKQALFSYDPQNSLSAQTPYERPHNEIAVIDALRKRVEAAGAAGAIAVLDASPEDARGAYYPYDGTLHHLPMLFVDRDAGARLKALANSGAGVRLVLSTEVKDVETRNLIGIIPGATDELTVINSHTDGTNGVEDNGPNAAIAIAQYLARLPRQSLPRSIMILLTSGHFAGGNGAVDFVNRHRADGLLGRIASAVTIEHLGAQEWLVDSTGRLAPTGQPEMSAVFTPKVAALVDASSSMLRRAGATRSFVLPPQHPENKGTSAIVWPGEGQYFWGQGDVPTVNYISGPSYLLHWGVSTADKVDYERMRRESISVTQMLLDLSRVPVSELR
ncbi:MAG TPA: L-rhamnose/proton symporter RhaT [Steroidobacteraceae bacterium]|jgi:hypothetical protein|nr:L-rhamnose/proton symporter RhaT [Steroidobacteraceae bacterium]